MASTTMTQESGAIVAKNDKSAARKYETIVVLSPDLGETQVKDEEKRIEGIIRKQQGDNIVIDRWGRKELAYPMHKQKTGSFTCFTYESVNGGLVKELEGLLRISDNVIKFQTHRLNERVRKFRGNPKRRMTGEGGMDDFLESDSEF